MWWLTRERLLQLKIYRSIENFSSEILEYVVEQNLNCKEAHAFLNTNKTTNSDVWIKMSRYYFGRDISNSYDFAQECSKNNPNLNYAMSEIIKFIFDTCLSISSIFYPYRDKFDYSLTFEYLNDLKSAFQNHLAENKSARSFLLGEREPLIQELIYRVCDFLEERYGYGYEFIIIMERQDVYMYSKFLNMFRRNTNLTTEQDENDFPYYVNLKQNIMTQYPDAAEIPFIKNVLDLLEASEDSIYISHFYLKDEWVDEVSITSEMFKRGGPNVPIPYLHIIGKLFIEYMDRNNIDDSIWASDQFTSLSDYEKESLKVSFRNGHVDHDTAKFSLSYVVEIEIQMWATILEGNGEDDLPTFYFREKVRDENNMITVFDISIRKSNLLKWFNSH